MSKIDEKICKAINIIAKRIVDKAEYDKTVEGVLMIESINNTERYRVVVGAAAYIAKPIDSSVEYKTGDKVYMLIPQNNINNTKFILGKK